MATYICSKCKKEKSIVSAGGGTGYGINRQGRKVCYQCCAEVDRAQMDKTGRAVLYLSHSSGNAGEVTNWPGTMRFSVFVKEGRHNIAGKRYDVTFKDHAGRRWHGVTYGNDTQLCHCRRLKV